jgi:hypothetical protein
VEQLPVSGATTTILGAHNLLQRIVIYILGYPRITSTDVDGLFCKMKRTVVVEHTAASHTPNQEQ